MVFIIYNHIKSATSFTRICMYTSIELDADFTCKTDHELDIKALEAL